MTTENREKKKNNTLYITQQPKSDLTSCKISLLPRYLEIYMNHELFRNILKSRTQKERSQSHLVHQKSTQSKIQNPKLHLHFHLHSSLILEITSRNLNFYNSSINITFLTHLRFFLQYLTTVSLNICPLKVTACISIFQTPLSLNSHDDRGALSLSTRAHVVVGSYQTNTRCRTLSRCSGRGL